MKCSVFLLVALLGTVGLSYAQQDQSAAAATIDGSQHPELIPDSIAYRLYFITVASMPANVQRSQLTSAGLSPTEVQAASKILADFKTAWDGLRNGYNQSVAASESTGVPPNGGQFALQRDVLVANTRAALQKVLSASGMQKFDAHVQGEKARMKTRLN